MVKSKLIKNQLVRDSFFYFFNQFVNLLVPIVIFPFINTKLTNEQFGEVLFFQSIAYIISIFGDLGLNVVGVKEFNKNKDFHTKVNIFCSIYTIRVAFFCLILLLFFTYFILFPTQLNNLFLFFVGLVVFEFFFPRWVFQAQQKASLIFRYTLVGKLIYVFGVYLYLENYGAWTIPFFLSLGSFISVALGFFKLRIFWYKKYVFNKHKCMVLLTEGLKVFFPKSLEKSIEYSFNIILGIVELKGLIVYSDLIMKSIKILIIPNTIIINSTFPYFSKHKSETLFKKLLYITPIVTFLISLIFYYNWSLILTYMNLGEMIFSNYSIYILAIIPPLISVNWIIGDNYLLIRSFYLFYSKAMMLRFLSFSLITFIYLTLFTNTLDLLLLFIFYILAILIDTAYKIFIYSNRTNVS